MLGLDVPTCGPRGLAIGVARCPEVERARANINHPCNAVVCSQSAGSEFQVPEGWAGNLAEARVIFLSSNPSISKPKEGGTWGLVEKYPLEPWTDSDIADFITARFSKWATAEGKYLQRDGKMSRRPVKFWLGTRKIAGELIGAVADPSRDYAMTEIVHCKSKGEVGVAKAADLCVERHMDGILRATTAPLIVILGGKALRRAAHVWDLPKGFGKSQVNLNDGQVDLVVRDVGGAARVIVYLRHPSVYGKLECVSDAYPADFGRLKELVAGKISASSFPTARIGVDS